MQQKTFTLVTAVIAVVLVIPAGYALWNITKNDAILPGDTSAITVLDAGAFGDLSAATSTSFADGKGGGGMGLTESTPMAESKLATTDSLVAEPYPFEPTVYVYTYDGDLSSYLTDASATVYERQSFGALDGSVLSDSASAFSHLDIGAFLSGDLTSFVLSANGYLFSADITGNTWSIYKDWTSYVLSDTWTPMTAEDLPSDATIISLAQSFVDSWGIDVSIYGEPVIGEPEIALARSGAPNVFAPESATVIFPVMVDGQKVYPTWSTAPTGLRITVNLRDLTVTNAYDALRQSYNASVYDLTQDADLVARLVAGGGNAPVTYEGIAIHEVTVPLHDPTRVLMEYSLYENGRSRTLFVPALRFTLENPSELPWMTGVVTVPLVKEIAEAQL